MSEAMGKSDLVAELFTVCQAGKLDEFIRKEVRACVRLIRGVNSPELCGNVLDITTILEHAAYLRDIVTRALPGGRLLGIPRAEIERLYGPQTWT